MESDNTEPDKPTTADDAADHEVPGLLQVQKRDTQIEQLRHKRRTLPLRDDLSVAESQQVAKQALIDETSDERAKATLRQKRFEGEAAMIDASASTKEDRLYSGEILSIKSLEALQSEVRSMRARQEQLEERAIEALIEVDDLTDTIDTLVAERTALDERIIVLEAELAAATLEIDLKIGDARTARDLAAATQQPEVLAKYERLRPLFGHSTAVSFDPAKGCGCPNQMPTAEKVRIKHHEPGEVLECSECGRLVLR